MTPLNVEQLMSTNALGRSDALIIGIFALKFWEGLVEAMPHVHQWFEKGGNMLSLYHRLWGNWYASSTPPQRLEIDNRRYAFV